MSWGSAFSSAWNAATSAAQSVCSGIMSTAAAAYDYLTQRAAAVAQGIQQVVHAVVHGVIAVYNAAAAAFGGAAAGVPLQPCPYAHGGGGPVVPGGTDPGTGPGTDPVTPEDDYAIVSVAWLNGDDVTTIGDCTQWVNLPREAKWLANSDIPNIDRLGISPRFLVTFNKAQVCNFQWRIVVEPGGTEAYSSGGATKEEERNSNFVPSSREWAMGSTDETGRGIADAARLVAGGGYKFKIEAKDHHDTVVTSGVIETKRLFWYVELPMTGLTSTLTTTAAVDTEFANHHIVLKQLPDLSIAHQQNIGNDTDSDTFAANVEGAITGNATAAAKAPYLLRIGYTDHLAVKNPNRPQRADGITVGPGVAATAIPVSSTGLRDGDGEAARWLWNNLVTGEGWFVSASYTPDGGGAAVDIPADKVTMTTPGNSDQSVTVDVTGLPAGTGSITVNVDVVDRMRGGLAIGGAANICICTRSWWNNSNDAKQACTVVHEMGHKVQMVAAGTGGQPDRVSTQYSGHGHMGSHCHNGLAAGLATYGNADVTATTCAMFGTVNRRTAFCGNCAPAVKKVDLGAGF